MSETSFPPGECPCVPDTALASVVYKKVISWPPSNFKTEPLCPVEEPGQGRWTCAGRQEALLRSVAAGKARSWLLERTPACLGSLSRIPGDTQNPQNLGRADETCDGRCCWKGATTQAEVGVYLRADSWAWG